MNNTNIIVKDLQNYFNISSITKLNENEREEQIIELIIPDNFDYNKLYNTSLKKETLLHYIINNNVFFNMNIEHIFEKTNLNNLDSDNNSYIFLYYKKEVKYIKEKDDYYLKNLNNNIKNYLLSNNNYFIKNINNQNLFSLLLDNKLSLSKTTTNTIINNLINKKDFLNLAKFINLFENNSFITLQLNNFKQLLDFLIDNKNENNIKVINLLITYTIFSYFKEKQEELDFLHYFFDLFLNKKLNFDEKLFFHQNLFSFLNTLGEKKQLTSKKITKFHKLSSDFFIEISKQIMSSNNLIEKENLFKNLLFFNDNINIIKTDIFINEKIKKPEDLINDENINCLLNIYKNNEYLVNNFSIKINILKIYLEHLYKENIEVANSLSKLILEKEIDLQKFDLVKIIKNNKKFIDFNKLSIKKDYKKTLNKLCLKNNIFYNFSLLLKKSYNNNEKIDISTLSNKQSNIDIINKYYSQLENKIKNNDLKHLNIDIIKLKNTIDNLSLINERCNFSDNFKLKYSNQIENIEKSFIEIFEILFFQKDNNVINKSLELLTDINKHTQIIFNNINEDDLINLDIKKKIINKTL